MTTQAQKIHLNAELWPAAAKQQGWNPRDRDKLYEIYAEVLGEREPHRKHLAAGKRISCLDFVSSHDRDDFGDVKKRLKLLAGEDLLQNNPVARQRVWIVKNRLMPCYRLYKPDAALDTILRERFKRVRGLNTIEDLGADDLKKLIFTLEARVSSARQDAGHGHHAMCNAAGVTPWKCPKNCPECRQAAGDNCDVPAEVGARIDENNPF